MLFSLIIPTYNSEKYINKCLDSITKQGFTTSNAEVIVIDDGSSDNTPSISKKYCKKYNYIKFIQKTNTGVSDTRNVGLQNALGEYISFLDSDDYVANNIYLPLSTCMKKNNLKMLRFNRTTNAPLESFLGEYHLSEEKYIVMSVSLCIYEARCIKENNISFDKNVFYREDFLFNYTYQQSVGCFYVAPYALYFNNINNSSSTANVFCNNQKKKKMYSSFIEIYKKIESKRDYKCFDNYLYDFALSGLLCNLVWLSIRGRIPPKKILLDINKKGLKKIKYKVFEGHSKKSKLKSIIEYKCKKVLIYKSIYYLYGVIMLLRKPN